MTKRVDPYVPPSPLDETEREILELVQVGKAAATSPTRSSTRPRPRRPRRPAMMDRILLDDGPAGDRGRRRRRRTPSARRGPPRRAATCRRPATRPEKPSALDLPITTEKIDDPVRMYLTQMGEIPLLTRDAGDRARQEDRDHAQALPPPRARQRRRASPSAIDILQEVARGDLPFDRTLRIGTADPVDKDDLQKRMPRQPDARSRSSAARPRPTCERAGARQAGAERRIARASGSTPRIRSRSAARPSPCSRSWRSRRRSSAPSTRSCYELAEEIAGAAPARASTSKRRGGERGRGPGGRGAARRHRVHGRSSRSTSCSKRVRRRSATASPSTRRPSASLSGGNLRLVVSIAKKYRNRGLSLPGPDPGRQHRPDAGGRQVRVPPRLQVLHLRHVVDSPGDHPRHRRPGPHDPHPGAHDRDDVQAAQRLQEAAPGARPRADDRGDRRGRRASRVERDPPRAEDQPPPDQPRPAGRRERGQLLRRLHRGRDGREPGQTPPRRRCSRTRSSRCSRR